MNHHPVPVQSLVTDALLLTPFRLQNIPPPMSSLRLATHPTSVSGVLSQPTAGQTSLHSVCRSISLAPQNDSLAVLHVNNEISLWGLNTRGTVLGGETATLAALRTKNTSPVYRPEPLKLRFVVSLIAHPRQVILRKTLEDKGSSEKLVAVLGTHPSSSFDAIEVLSSDGTNELIGTTSQGGILLATADGRILLQSETGEIQTGWWRRFS